jgi:hypothetical protein
MIHDLSTMAPRVSGSTQSQIQVYSPFTPHARSWACLSEGAKGQPFDRFKDAWRTRKLARVHSFLRRSRNRLVCTLDPLPKKLSRAWSLERVRGELPRRGRRGSAIGGTLQRQAIRTRFEQRFTAERMVRDYLAAYRLPVLRKRHSSMCSRCLRSKTRSGCRYLPPVWR